MTIALEQNPAPIFPKGLLAGGQACKTWFVVHVKSRREKALADFLFRRSTGYYLPMMQKRQSSAKRIRYSLVPVFPGYVFINTDETGRYNALRSNHVCRFIDVEDPATLMYELNQIYHALSGDTPVYPVEFVGVGQRVRVKKGPMKDVEGTVLRKDKKYRLVLSVTSIMQSISLEIDADMVEPV